MKIFILEDDENRIERFKRVLQHYDFDCVLDMKDIERGCQPPYDLYFLDHDLGGLIFTDSGDYNTGYSFCKWLYENHPETKGVVIIHSANPPGAEYMKSFLDRYMSNIVSYKIPFMLLTDDMIQKIIDGIADHL